MDQQRALPELNDVLDYYLLSTEERGADTLLEMIELFPQYEQDMRELSAFRKLGEMCGNPELTEEQETALQTRAMGVVQKLLHEAR